MKGIIVEIRNENAAVLLEGGEVRRYQLSELPASSEALDVGSEIVFPEKAEEKVISIHAKPRHSLRRNWKAIAAAVSALVLLAGGGSYTYAYAAPYAYVSLDVNPSVEYTLNRMNQVIEVSALNDDAKTLTEALESVSLKHKDIEEALALTKELFYEEKILSEDEEEYLLINVSSPSEKKAEQIIEKVGHVAGRDNEQTVVSTGTEEERKQAQELGMSTGRYVAMHHSDEMENPADESERILQFRDEPVEEILQRAGMIERPGDESRQPEGAPEGGPGNDSGALPDGGPGNMPEDTPDSMPESMPEDAPDSMPQGGPGK